MEACSKCGHIDSKNRKDQAHFKCLKCGYVANTNYNATVNIRNIGTGTVLKTS